MSEFWTALLESVFSFFGLVTQGRRSTLEMSMFSDDLSGMTIGGMGAGTTDLGPTPAPPLWVQAKAQLETLQKADPDFLEATFLAQASKTFAAVLAAEGVMDASAIAALVTPGYLQHFQARIDDWKGGGFTRVVSDLSLDSPTTFKVSIGGDTQAITVRFTGSVKRFTREDMTNIVSDGSAQAASFTEFATFVRPAGSTTPKTVALAGALHCPSCGAPVADGALKCTFCGATVSGSGGSWLLDKTSASAYT
ncbi:MAG TPA: TIM44-like domain-containing protein [Candidatus Eremiobacteraceae bacterium]|nr:TIM44-like domain-containing protein [Candidatus Eremiobacteraceae bacterium]